MMEIHPQEALDSLNELSAIIDYGHISISSFSNSPMRIANLHNNLEYGELSAKWENEYLTKRDILHGLKDTIENNIPHSYWVSRAKEFLEVECNSLPDKIEKSLGYVPASCSSDLDKYLTTLRKQNTSFFITYTGKIKKLAQRFAGYQIGEQITENSIIKWLEQFQTDRRMSLALCLLNKIKFIRVEDAYQKYIEFYQNLSPSEAEELLIFQYGTPTEGTPAREKDFIDALSSIGRELRNDVEVTSNLKPFLRQDNYHKKTVVIVDDIVGTGNQYHDIFNELFNISKTTKYVQARNKLTTEIEKKRAKEMKWFIIVHFSLQRGEKKIKEVFENFDLQYAELKILSGNHSYHCFDDKVNTDGEVIFEQDIDSEEARQMCYEIGKDIYKEKHALGFLDSGQLIVFSHKTPNNTLPIFWEDGNYQGVPWIPLFPRKTKKK